MAEKKLTIFQRLNKVFGPEGVKVPQEKTNRYSIGREEILKTTSRTEYDTAKKQAQQNRYLSQLWQKVDGEMYQQSIHYEVTRIGSYADFESMEFFPEIAAALDIMMEESTTPNDKGKILNIYSESTRVKGILEDLFFNRLDCHTNLPAWTRNLCKYGDNFIFLNVDDKGGVIGARQMPNFEMERREGDLYNMLLARSRIMGSTGTKTEYDNKIKFYWKTKDVEFNSWQIAHFRLLGDDRKLPYGTSVLEKARRIWKQLLLSEDAMLIYRVTRAPERRIYKIYVGNVDDADVPAYVNEIANRFKRLPVIDPATGQIDLRYNQLGQDQDIFVPTRDESAPSPIDTLPGASNLSEIADIEYLQNKLFTALRVPKPFLGFDAAIGEGKNLALMDIRFSRTINRIQQAILMELNKIAIIHLYVLGFEDELDNFILTLNNPSTQAEMLKIEHLQQKVTLYKDAVSDAGNGFAAMSMTKGKKEILGFSDEEIKQDLLEQRIEKAAAAELAKTASIIKQTGFFDKVDNIYGDPKALEKIAAGEDVGGEEGADEGADIGGGGGGGGFGGGGFGETDVEGEAGAEADTEADTEAGAEGGFGEEAGAEPTKDAGNAETGGAPAFGESSAQLLKNAEKLLTEQKKLLNEKLEVKTKRYQTVFLDRLTNSAHPVDKALKDYTTKITDKNLKINEGINNMIEDINKKLRDV
jgi:hypothetical protein